MQKLFTSLLTLLTFALFVAASRGPMFEKSHPVKISRIKQGKIFLMKN